MVLVAEENREGVELEDRVMVAQEVVVIDEVSVEVTLELGVLDTEGVKDRRFPRTEAVVAKEREGVFVKEAVEL